MKIGYACTGINRSREEVGLTVSARAPRASARSRQEAKVKTLELRLSWAQAEDMPILLANQLLLQSVGDVVLMTVGQVAHPALTGPDDPRGSELVARGEVTVRPIIRVALTSRSAAEFAEVFATLAKSLGETPEVTTE